MEEKKIIKIRNKINLKRNHWIHYRLTNCYAYALGLDINENKLVKDAYKPGVMSNYSHVLNKSQLFTREHLIEALFQDMKLLGIEITEISITDQIEVNSWKVALFITRYTKNNSKLYDFHFMREISNNMWYHKVGFDSFPNNYDDNSNIIVNPELCYLQRREYDSCYCLKLKK